jgi:hypothetical protein
LRNTEIPGQQLINAVDRVIGNPLQHLAQVEFRIDSVEFGCSEQSAIYRTFKLGRSIATENLACSSRPLVVANSTSPIAKSSGPEIVQGIFDDESEYLWNQARYRELQNVGSSFRIVLDSGSMAFVFLANARARDSRSLMC